ncbi:hypothetical protein L0668_00660 [Paraglaciecola aquimarina]|uniref:Mutarotase n=1 Tax=Paraglaciecola algarum TaxID=3050085 RepID=A0ABS9D0Z5_9ALTE|nr:hypothetical protein [Paraglaciecola sp. G1-23]MCF2946603.1 hypothetical protein [Paraglaciecola sp. G1-23]
MKNYYQQMWQQGIAAIQQKNEVPDPNIGDLRDTRRGITLLARLPKKVTKQVSTFLVELDKICPNQYCYPESDMHLTIMSIVSCKTGFAFDPKVGTEYLNVLKTALQGIGKFSVDFSGISVSNSAVLLTGYTNNLFLEKLRANTREAIRKSNLLHSMDTRYKIKTAHSTVMRYKSPISNSLQLIQFLTNNQFRQFGEMQVDNLELVFNDWYQTQEQSKFIGKISLN